MRAAITVWEGRVSPVFDVSREALILTIDRGAVVDRHTENIEAATPPLKIERLLELGVETLVCGAISESMQQELSARSVRVLGFVAGEIDEVLRAYLSGALPAPALSMPGYCGRQKRFRGGREGR